MIAQCRLEEKLKISLDNAEQEAKNVTLFC